MRLQDSQDEAARLTVLERFSAFFFFTALVLFTVFSFGFLFGLAVPAGIVHVPFSSFASGILPSTQKRRTMRSEIFQASEISLVVSIFIGNSLLSK